MENTVFLEPRSTFDSMIIGVSHSIDKSVLAYDKDKILEHLTKEILSTSEGVSEEDAHLMAIEYFDFNILGAYWGEGTPVYVSKEDLDIEEL